MMMMIMIIIIIIDDFYVMCNTFQKKSSAIIVFLFSSFFFVCIVTFRKYSRWVGHNHLLFVTFYNRDLPRKLKKTHSSEYINATS